MVSIYDTPEMYCWCRDFGYAQYLEVHQRSGLKSAPQTEKSYALLGEAFYNQMVETFDAERRAELQERVACPWLESLGAARTGAKTPADWKKLDEHLREADKAEQKRRNG